MTASGCDQWVDLVDREALGEPISKFEREIGEKHLRKCKACRTEARTWAALTGALSDSDVLETPVLPPLYSARLFGFTRQLAWKRVIVAGGLAAAAAVSLVFAWDRADLLTTADDSTKVAFSAVSGDVLVEDRKASAGVSPLASERIRVQRGRACLAFDAGISTCLGEASDASVQSQGLSRGIELRVGRVLAKLERQPTGATFSIRTPRGAVVAKGTVFSVEVSESRLVTVRVHEGAVVVERPGAVNQTLSAPSEASFSERFERTPLSSESARRDASLIAVATLLSRTESSRLDVTATPQGARVLLDNVELGRAPVSALVSGSRRITVEHPGYSPVSERLVLNEATNIFRSYELVPLSTAAPVSELETAENSSATAEPSVPAESGARATAGELLSRARTLRRNGRYREAATAYRKLFSAHPKSAEARASLVSLGELQLGELGEPKGALESFDAYLKGGGALTQEARYGRIRALARLGRKNEERRAIEQFMGAYPRSVQASSLRARQAL